MKGSWLFALLIAALAVSTSLEAKPRLVSTNLCTDQLLLLLADPEQILSLSKLAADREHAFLWREAANFPLNRASAEEIIAARPDQVLVSDYSSRLLSERLTEQRIPVASLPAASSLADIDANIRRMAGWTDQRERGEALIRQMHQRLDAARAQLPAGPPAPALFLQPNGYTSGANTLQDTALQLGGWRNLAAENGIDGYRRIELEQVVELEPARIFTSSDPLQRDALALRILRHPALERLNRRQTPLRIDYRYWICGGPMLADAVEQLVELRRSNPG